MPKNEPVISCRINFFLFILHSQVRPHLLLPVRPPLPDRPPARMPRVSKRPQRGRPEAEQGGGSRGRGRGGGERLPEKVLFVLKKCPPGHYVRV